MAHPLQRHADGQGARVAQRVLLGSNGEASSNDPLTVSFETCGYVGPQGASSVPWRMRTTRQMTDAYQWLETTVWECMIGDPLEQRVVTKAPDGEVLTQVTSIDRSTGTVTTAKSSSRATNEVQ